MHRICIGTFFIIAVFILTGCQTEAVPTRAQLAELPSDSSIPPTFTPPAETAVPTATQAEPISTSPPTNTPLPIPTNTPITPTSTPSNTPTPVPVAVGSATPMIKSLHLYSKQEIIPYQAFPVPAGNNGWGMHWMPTVSQDQGTVDRFVDEMVRMHIKWVVFLNDGTGIGANDYLVDKLVANGIMPVMRLYRDGVLPYDGNLGELVAHYRPRGVYYYQLYNEPNVNIENHQSFANPNQYATAWSNAARIVIANGGLPGIGALSPGGSYNHFNFLGRTLQAIKYNGDEYLLNHAWLSIHNYHGLRAYNDPGGFLLYKEYDEIVRNHIGRSLPVIGTEGGSYSPDPNVELQFATYQYTHMRNREPYFLAFSWWLLANREGGGHDEQWEWQTLIRPGYVHPIVTEFFYKNTR